MKARAGGLAALAVLVLSTACGAGELPQWRDTFPKFPMDEVRLGQLLYYDPILSGNRGVACATCHHPRFGTSDGLSLGLGDGASGMGPERKAEAENYPELRVARNAPGLFNLGAPEFVRMFDDGRLEVDPTRPLGIRSPLEQAMVPGFDSVLSAQAMFPVLAPDEMAGHYSESDVSQAVRKGFLSMEGGAWDIIAGRVEAIPEYRAAFDKVIGPGESIQFFDVSNAIAAFVTFEFRADDSPFDRYLRGEGDLDPAAERGLNLFYGRAGCDGCHSGLYQTDHQFHAIGMPQIGPGKTERFESHHRDVGRMRVTNRAEDAHRFRTPSLRNATLTAPYGHDGAYGRLEDVVRHHLDPLASLAAYDPQAAGVVLPELENDSDWSILTSPAETQAIAAANELAPIALSDAEVADLLAFLAALTDNGHASGRLGVPARVPSGLPVPQ